MRSLFFIFFLLNFSLQKDTCNTHMMCLRANKMFAPFTCVTKTLGSKTGICMALLMNKENISTYCKPGTYDDNYYKIRTSNERLSVRACEYSQHNNQPSEPMADITIPKTHQEHVDLNGERPRNRKGPTKPVIFADYMAPLKKAEQKLKVENLQKKSFSKKKLGKREAGFKV